MNKKVLEVIIVHIKGITKALENEKSEIEERDKEKMAGMEFTECKEE